MPEPRRDQELGEYLFGPPSPLLHVVCCDPDVAFCGDRLDEEEDTEPGEDERTEDCLPCLHEETRRDRGRLGCGSPQCPHQPLWRRLRYLLWRSWEWPLVIALLLLSLLLLLLP